MPKFQVEFDGFDQMLTRLKKLEGDAKEVTEEALKETFNVVTKKAEAAIKPHRETGETEASLRQKPQIQWQGSVGTVHVGFDMKSGGLPSIFLMYGTPRMEKDQKLYNAFYGAATKREIHAAQEEVFFKEIRRLEE